ANESSYRLSTESRQPVSPCLLNYRQPNVGEPGALQARRLVAGNEMIVLGSEPVLLDLRVERCKGVLPAPDDDRPRHCSEAADDEDRAEKTKTSSHRATSTVTTVIPAGSLEQ